MPTFDLRGIRVAKYDDSSGSVKYSGATSAGDAMGANLELKFAEGRLYAEGSLAEFLKEAVGGSISLAVKYIPAPAQTTMYGCTETSRTLTSTGATVKGVKHTSRDEANYVGVSFYAPDRVDGKAVYTCVFVPKSLFGPPSLVYQTKGDSLTFQTPTTTGEFLPDKKTGELLLEIGFADTVEDAIAWTKQVLGEEAGA